MFRINCAYCDKVIDGYTEKQVQYLLDQHVLSKHRDKVMINEPEEIENGLN